MREPTPGIDPAAALNDWKRDQPSPDAVWDCHTVKLVTPMYGGGVRPGEIDPSMPIRAAGIRGQLRFWWRIACGPFESAETMFARESAIWGGISGSGPSASKVAVRVDQVRGLNIQAAFTYKSNRNRPGEYRTMPDAADWIEPYAAFPARGELSHDKRVIEKAPHALALAGLGFRLGLRLHTDLSEPQRWEVKTALRWWASFGGIGARTRRGLGAVQVGGLDVVTAEAVSARNGRLVLGDAATVAEQAWKVAVGRLGDFRQKRGLGRNESRKDKIPAGRSRWPEPDVIRRQTQRHAPEHAPEHPVTDALPRAAFGLPIVFHFKDESQGDPPQQLLVPREGDRMASPLILRPYWDGQHWRPAALLLPGWEQALTPEVGFGDGPYRRAWPKDLAERRCLSALIKPMVDRGDDPLTAFLDYFARG